MPSRPTARALRFGQACGVHKGGNVPSQLFNFLFILALFVPAAMYVGGLFILMISLVVKHYRVTHHPHGVEALAH